MGKETTSVDELRDAINGWAGTFHFEDGVLGFFADACRKGECDCSLNECGYTIAEQLDDHVGESLAVLLNAPRVLLDGVDAFNRLQDRISAARGSRT